MVQRSVDLKSSEIKTVEEEQDQSPPLEADAKKTEIELEGRVRFCKNADKIHAWIR